VLGASHSQISRTITVLIATCLFAFPAHAKYSGGTGEPNDPYQIATAADLIALGETPADYGKHFILTADIDLDPNLPGRKVFDRAVIAPATYVHERGWWGISGTPFEGVLDGRDHTIAHLTIAGDSCAALFGYLGRGEVRNLGLRDVNVAGSGSHVGGLVGYNGGIVTRCHSDGAVSGGSRVGGLVGQSRGEVTQCYGTAAVSGNSCVGGLVGENGHRVTQCHGSGVVSGGSCVGGLVGHNVVSVGMGTSEGGTIAENHTSARVSGEDSVGGLVGDNGYGTVVHSYSTGAVSGTGCVGGLVGRDDGGDVTQSYSTGSVSGSGGGLVGCAAGAYGVMTGCFWDIQTSGQAGSAGGAGLTTAAMKTASSFSCWADDAVWTIDEGTDYPRLWWEHAHGEPVKRVYFYGGGSGSLGSPYLIYAAEQLNMIGLIPCDWDKHFKLMEDIDLSVFDAKEGWPAFRPIYSFAGVFDGNGHVVLHLVVSGRDYLGLFGQLESSGEVKDLGVVDVNITGSGASIGALVGYSRGNVTRCHSAGTVNGQFFVGGLVGGNYGIVRESRASAGVTGESSVGGLVGYNDGAVTRSYCAATVRGGKEVGGLVGHNAGPHFVSAPEGWRLIFPSIAACYSTGAVSGDEAVGGLLGFKEEKYVAKEVVTACFWDTQTSGQATSAGGIGKPTVEIQTAKTFLEAGWDFVGETANGTEDIWWILEGEDYPRLWWEAHD
jgi:hypothetical protein